MRKRESKTRKVRRRPYWPCWASLGPFSIWLWSSLSTSTLLYRSCTPVKPRSHTKQMSLIKLQYADWHGDKNGGSTDYFPSFNQKVPLRSQISLARQDAELPQWYNGSKTARQPHAIHPASLWTTETMGNWHVPLPFTGRIIQNIWSFSTCIKWARNT